MELTGITIEQKYKDDTRVHFTQALHTFQFNIKFRVSLIIYD